MYIDKIPVLSIENGETIEYLEFRHQALTLEEGCSSVVLIAEIVSIVSWRLGCSFGTKLNNVIDSTSH